MEESRNIEIDDERKDLETCKEYFFGKYKLILKNNNPLEKFQTNFPLYDHFLPFFCKKFNGLIIDIGANIGDTTIAILAQNDGSFIVSVEADIDFFSECLQNITLNNLNGRTLLVNKFITTKKGNFIIKKNESLSTGSIEEFNEDLELNNSMSFNELMAVIPEEKKTLFDLLKIDTDSFDWDIILTFVHFLKLGGIRPRFVFFEMQCFYNNTEEDDIDRDVIIYNYKNALIELKQQGYTKFCLFDNFGTYFKTTESIDEIIELAFYIRSSQLFNSFSTIYYFDILAFADSESNFVNNVLNEIYIYENHS